MFTFFCHKLIYYISLSTKKRKKVEFRVDDISVEFGGHSFQQIRDTHMITMCPPYYRSETLLIRCRVYTIIITDKKKLQKLKRLIPHGGLFLCPFGNSISLINSKVFELKRNKRDNFLSHFLTHSYHI